MKIDILTLFPEFFDAFTDHSIIGRAQANKIIDITAYNIRDFAKNKHKQADDYPYGGGAGMVMSPQPLSNSIRFVLDKYTDKKPKVIYLSPQGRVLSQSVVKEFAKEEAIILLCGHYEGIDQRIIDTYVDEEVSIGDYVLTGGELPAMVLIDCVARMIPGVLGSSESIIDESHTAGLLEYPHYTRPQEFEDKTVPEVLLSGHHKEINKWRKTQSLRNTLLKRPDLLDHAQLSDEDRKIISNFLLHNDTIL